MSDKHSAEETPSLPKPSVNEPVKPASTETERSDHKGPSNWYRQLTTESKITFWSTVVSAGATAVMAIFTGLLWVNANNQLASFQEVERALVIPTEVQFTKFPVAHDPTIAITIKVKNAGRTTSPKSYLFAVIGHVLEPFPITRPGAPPSKYDMGPMLPNSLFEGKFSLEYPAKWGQDYIDKLKDGTMKLYFWGLVQYQDGFGNERQTRFCYIYVPTNEWDTCKEPGYTDAR